MSQVATRSDVPAVHPFTMFTAVGQLAVKPSHYSNQFADYIRMGVDTMNAYSDGARQLISARVGCSCDLEVPVGELNIPRSLYTS